MRGAGEEDEVAGDGDRLDRKVPGQERGVAEEEAKLLVGERRGERPPFGSDRVEGGHLNLAQASLVELRRGRAPRRRRWSEKGVQG